MSRLTKATALNLIKVGEELLEELRAQYEDRNLDAESHDEWIEWRDAVERGRKELGIHDQPPEWFDFDFESAEGHALFTPGKLRNVHQGYFYHHQAGNPARRIPEGWYRGKRVVASSSA